MKLENQVCTLEQAKRLQQLGVDGDSINHYYTYPPNNESGYRLTMLLNPKEVNAINAYNCAELGVMLPDEVSTVRRYGTKGIALSNSDDYTYWVCESEYSAGYAITEAISKAEQLIYLLENNLTTAAEVNERLAKG